MLTIGLTGSIATGKSEVARLLAAHGARVVDADHLAHEVYAPRAPGYAAILAAFGRDVLAPDASIDRHKLGAIVFDDPAAMKRLTDIVWPLTRARVEEIKRTEEIAGRAVLVLEAPLLLEAGWRDLVDQVWLVRARDQAARDRLIEGRGLSRSDAEARIAARNRRATGDADVIIENEGDLAALAGRVEEAWLTLVARKLV